jgi:BolA family transcriptional regulator, general stress-responsive regulator
MPTKDLIQQKITHALQCEHLDIINESHMHAGPRTDSHFKLIVVSKDFSGQARIKRHQLIYRILSEELSTSVHALSLYLYTPEEWSVREEVPDSPLCAGKNNPI